LGYHGATSSLNGNGKQQVNTYMFASYSDPGIFRSNDGDSFSYISDIHALSHEVQEWYDDPSKISPLGEVSYLNTFLNCPRITALRTIIYTIIY